MVSGVRHTPRPSFTGSAGAAPVLPGSRPHRQGLASSDKPSNPTTAMKTRRSLLFAALLLIPGMAARPGDLRAQESPADDIGGVVRGSLDDPEAYPRPIGHALRVDDAVELDGRLDEPLWQRAELFTDFVQSQPDPGRLASERSEVRVVYDDDYLYIGAMLYDSHAGEYVVQSLERDFPSLSTRDADMFSIALDTFLDRRNSYLILINPWGAYRDGQTFNDSRNTDFGFDAPAEVQTWRGPEGWSLELRIPWSGLRYEGREGEQLWGINFLRRVRRINEDSYWAPLERRDPLHRMSKAGTLEGLIDLPESGAFWVKPYGLAASQSGVSVDQGLMESGQSDLGLDVKYGITPGLTLDATLNTDFSQVEVDQERVNLDRFPLFFSEQRDFFVENSGSFTFGDQTERNYRMGASLRDFTLFHSRVIGLDGGRPVPILAGARVSGRAGPWELGLLDMRTGNDQGVAGENFAVLRVRREISGSSDIGAMFIDRSRMGGVGANDGRSYGVDANVNPLPGLLFNSYFAATDRPGETGDQRAWRLGAAYRDRRWNVSALYRRFGEAFNPAVGFVRRTGVEHLYGTLGILRYAPQYGLQEIQPYVEADHFSDLSGQLVTRGVTGGVDVTFMSGATLRTSATDRFEYVDAPFRVGGETIDVGGYDFSEATLEYASSAGRPFSASVRLGGGSFFSGTRRSVGAGFRWVMGHQLAVQGSADFNRIELPGGLSNSSVYQGRVKYALSTRAFAALNVQYNEVTQQLVTYGRFNVIHGPLSDLFVVITERRQLGSTPRVLDRTITAKVTRLLAF